MELAWVCCIAIKCTSADGIVDKDVAIAEILNFYEFPDNKVWNKPFPMFKITSSRSWYEG